MAVLGICVVIVVEPRRVSVDQTLQAATQLFGRHALDITEKGRTSIEDSDLWDIDAGPCRSTDLTAEQRGLFGRRVSDPTVHVYFVRSTDPPYAGCAAHPADRPGVIVTSEASLWTLAHELGHVMGLRHAGGSTRLMTGGGTASITKNPPDLVDEEIRAIMKSPHVQP